MSTGNSETLSFSWDPGTQEKTLTLVARAALPAGETEKNPGDNTRSLDVQIVRGRGTLTVSTDKASYRIGDFVTLRHRFIDGGLHVPAPSQVVARRRFPPPGQVAGMHTVLVSG